MGCLIVILCLVLLVTAPVLLAAAPLWLVAVITVEEYRAEKAKRD